MIVLYNYDGFIDQIFYLKNTTTDDNWIRLNSTEVNRSVFWKSHDTQFSIAIHQTVSFIPLGKGKPKSLSSVLKELGYHNPVGIASLVITFFLPCGPRKWSNDHVRSTVCLVTTTCFTVSHPRFRCDLSQWSVKSFVNYVCMFCPCMYHCSCQ